MAKTTQAESAPAGDRKEGQVLVGRDWQGNPIYRDTADKPQETEAPNVTDK